MTPERKSDVTITFPAVPAGCATLANVVVSLPRKTKEDAVVDACNYALFELPPLTGERVFQLDRMDVDRPERWHVRVTAKWMACDCRAGALAKVKCKHLLVIEKVLEQEKYREPAADSQAA